VLAIAIYGDRVYVGGQLTGGGLVSSQGIVVYNRASDSWEEVGGGAGGNVQSFISSLVVKGSDLYAAGNFAAIGTTLSHNISRWDGQKWHQMGNGTNDKIYALAVAGTDLYAAGEFTTAGSVPANHIARWDGAAWSAVGEGADGPVRSLGIGNGVLYAGGTFNNVGGVAANNIARLAVSTGVWSALGSGVGQTDNQLTPEVDAILPLNGDLYVGGNFRRAGTDSSYVRHIARWDGTRWSALQPAGDTSGRGVASTPKTSLAAVYALAAGGDDLLLGGVFTRASMLLTRTGLIGDGDEGSVYQAYSAFNIARWSLSQKIWRAFGDSPNGEIRALGVDGTMLYAAGRFTTAGGIPVNNIARWNSADNSWSPLGAGLGGVTSVVQAIAVSGGNVYAGVNEYTNGGTFSGSYVSRWDGSSWSNMGAHFSTFMIAALAADGNTVYVGGQGSGAEKGGLFKWNGTSWGAPGSGVDSGVASLAAVGGGVLYVGGNFTTAGGVPARNIARWSEATQSWSGLGSGTDGPVLSIGLSGDRLYVGGIFGTAGGASARNVAAWNTTDQSWETLGGGLNAAVRAITVTDAGTVFAGGDFQTTGDISVFHVAKWDGETWDALGSGTNDTVTTMASGGEIVYVGGVFALAGDQPSFNIGRWGAGSSSVGSFPPRAAGGRFVRSSPNPVASAVRIEFSTEFYGTATVCVLDPLGRQIATLVDGQLPPGEHIVTWDAGRAADGIYFCRLRTSRGEALQKLVVRR
jgi:hypothetical protein